MVTEVKRGSSLWVKTESSNLRLSRGKLARKSRLIFPGVESGPSLETCYSGRQSIQRSPL